VKEDGRDRVLLRDGWEEVDSALTSVAVIMVCDSASFTESQFSKIARVGLTIDVVVKGLMIS
jgi:hypothetical protein